MSRRLAPVLDSSDLPLAELQAARLDGEVFSIGEAFAPVDELEQGRHRALSIRCLAGDRLIADRLTAAWIHGALLLPPERHAFCVPYSARGSVPSPRYTVREVVISEDEVTLMAGVKVTRTKRTTIDLLRQEQFSALELAAVIGLIRDCGVSLEWCRAHLLERHKLAGKRAALERIDAIESSQELTR